MCLRISSALLVAVLLAGCGSVSEDLPGEMVDCAIGAGADFSAVCSVERTETQGSGTLLVHHPGGGFRRFAYDAANNSIETADGADPVLMEPSEGGYLMFSVGGDQYRIPIDLLADR